MRSHHQFLLITNVSNKSNSTNKTLKLIRGIRAEQFVLFVIKLVPNYDHPIITVPTATIVPAGKSEGSLHVSA